MIVSLQDSARFPNGSPKHSHAGSLMPAWLCFLIVPCAAQSQAVLRVCVNSFAAVFVLPYTRGHPIHPFIRLTILLRFHAHTIATADSTMMRSQKNAYRQVMTNALISTKKEISSSCLIS